MYKESFLLLAQDYKDLLNEKDFNKAVNLTLGMIKNKPANLKVAEDILINNIINIII
jgi:hypothetical protein